MEERRGEDGSEWDAVMRRGGGLLRASVADCRVW
jgi:hypothetical protein